MGLGSRREDELQWINEATALQELESEIPQLAHAIGGLPDRFMTEEPSNDRRANYQSVQFYCEHRGHWLGKTLYCTGSTKEAITKTSSPAVCLSSVQPVVWK